MTRQEEGRRPSLGGKDGHEGSTSPLKTSKAELAEAKARGESPTSSLTSSPTKIHIAPSPEKKKKLPKLKMMKQEVEMEKRPDKEQKKQRRNDEETTAKEAADNRKSDDSEEVEDEEEKGSTEEESEEDEVRAVDNNNSDATGPVGSAGGLFFLRRSRRKTKARQQQQQEKQREVRRVEKRQQLIKLKRLVEGDAAQPVELELPGSGQRERNVEFVTKKAAALMKSKEDNGDEEDGGDGDGDGGEETTTPKERRKNSLGSFGYGLWVPPSGRRRAMTDSELVITEHRPDGGVTDLPAMRRKGSLTKGPLVTTFTLQRKGSDNSKSPPKKEKEKEKEKKEEKEKERKRKLKNLSRSAPAGPVLSSEDDDEEDGEEDGEEEDDDDSEEDEFGEDDDDDDDEDDEDDERACRYNQDTSPAFRNRCTSKEDNRRKDEEFVPRAAFLDLVLLEAKDLLVLNKRAMRKLFKHKLFAPFFTVSVGENTTRTKRTTIASPTFNHHLTFVYQEGGEVEPTLSVKLFYRCRTKAHRARRLHVGTMEVPLARLAAGKTHDLWLPIVPTCDYQLLWNWQKLGNDASNDARDARVSAKSKDRSRTRLGSVHMTIHKSLDQSAGALSALGLPSLAVPLRLQVGDVILFHCSQLASHGAKLATRSRWDHVAMVAKHRKREGLYLFEATRDGVHLFHLDRRLAFYLESRTELGVRRLRTERTEEMEAALHDFVAEVDGRPYKTNPLELLRALRDSNECDNLDTIFCSQLVAAAYQRMGILSQELCSNNYLPADFATAKISDHLIGAELDEVVLVPPVRQKGGLDDDQPFGSGVGGSAPGSFQIGSFPF